MCKGDVPLFGKEKDMSVYVHLATGFEELEALSPVDVLRRGGVDVKTVSVTEEKTVAGSHGILVTADLLFSEADYDDCEMIVLPGGLPGAANLGLHEGLCEKILEFHGAGKYTAAICAAPMVFGALGILEGKKATIYPGMEKELKGAEATGGLVVRDGSVITGKGPGAALPFALELLTLLKGQAAADAVRSGMLIA